MAQPQINVDPSEQALLTALAGAFPAAAGVFPLSPNQEGLWFAERFDPGTAAYNLAQGWRLRGALDLRTLKRSLNALVRRHETLRTVFEEIEQRPVQVVLPPRDGELLVTDLGHEADRETVLEECLSREAGLAFAVAGGPLTRFHLFRLTRDDHVLFLNLHHAISDEWSMAVVIRDLAALYAAQLSSEPAALPGLPVQYADFALWQRRLAGSVGPHLDYWREHLRGPLPALDLPYDHPRPARPSCRGRTLYFEWPLCLLQDLQRLSRSQGCTLFMTLLAGFKALLNRYCRQEDILVGSPMAGRDHVETEGLIGFFVRIHALRTALSGDPTFVELLARVRQTVLGAYAHQEIPAVQIVDALRLERHPGRHPLFQVVFGLQPAQPENWAFPGLTATPIDLDNGTSKFEWTVLATETPRGLRFRCEFRTEVLEPGTIARMMRHLQNLLQGALSNPNMRLSELPLMEASERQELLRLWNEPTTLPAEASASCLHCLFEAQVRRSPGTTAVVFGAEHLTYGELNTRANQLAHFLRAKDVRPETPVALLLERSFDQLVAILGVLKTGGAYVPLDPSSPRERLHFMLEDTQAPILLTNCSLLASLGAPRFAKVVCLDAAADSLAAEPAADPENQSVAENAAYIIFTSGSTGTPKGVVVTHRNVVRLLRNTQPWFHFDSADAWTLFHSFSFDFSVWEFWGALAHGARLVLVPYLVSRSPAEFYELLVKEKITVLNQTPSAFRQLMWAEAAAPQPEKLALRHVILGGEALDIQSLKPWFERHGESPALVNMYGITETTVHVTYRRVQPSDLTNEVRSPIGIPIPDLRLYLLDEHSNPVPMGAPGELCISGAGVARGYLNRPDLTRERFVPDPFQSGARLYRSGDLARFTSGGELEYLGRFDQQLKIRGFRVEPGEIESVLNGFPGVRRGVVIGQPGPSGDQVLVSYFVTENTGPTSAELRQHLARRLPDYMVPACFIPVESLPLNANGKLDLRALLATPRSGGQEARPRNVVPRNETERELMKIWRQVLEVREVGVEDNFFHIGGHSLLATQVASRIAAAFGIEFSVRALFEAPTLEALAEAVSHARHEIQVPGKGIGRTVHASEAQKLLARLDQLSDEEVEELLRASERTTISA